MRKQSSHSKRGERGAPSLYETLGGNGEGAATSILADLEPRQGRRKRRGWIVGLCVLFAAGAIAYVAGTETSPVLSVTVQQPAQPATAQTGQQAPAEPQAGPASVVADAGMPESAPPDLPLQALAVGAGTAVAAGSAPVINEINDANEAPPASKAATPEPRKAQVSEKRNVQSPKQKQVAAKQTAKPQPAAKKQEQKRDQKREQKRDQKREQKGDGDYDVDLIAALLSHVSQPGGATGKAGVAPGMSARPAANRDVVLRNPGETTDGLLKRCRDIGDLEGILCRERICTGLWGKDPSCPAMPQRSD